jgi:hypothetical protein
VNDSIYGLRTTLRWLPACSARLPVCEARSATGQCAGVTAGFSDKWTVMITCTLLKNTHFTKSFTCRRRPTRTPIACLYIHFCRRKTSLGKVNKLLFPLPRQRNAHHTIVLHYYITISKRNHQLAKAVRYQGRHV